MSVADCLAKIVASGQISKRVADQALAMHKRMQAEFAPETGPASAEAAAALTAAKALEARAAAKMRNVQSQVAAFKEAEQRVLEHPYGRAAALNGLLTKDPFRDGAAMKGIAEDHPLRQGPNVDYRQQVVAGKLASIIGETAEPFRPGLISGPPMESVKNFVRELFGVKTGDKAASDFAQAFNKAIDFGQQRVQRAGKIFEANEDWRLPQPWSSERVHRFSEAEFMKAWQEHVSTGGVKIWDDEAKNFAQPGSQRETDILRRAYSDIKSEGGVSSPFSKERRTFQFQPGETGAKAWLAMQQKFGVGDNIIATALQHTDRMAREIALAETLGPSHQATFAALLRRVKEEPGVKGMAGVPARLTGMVTNPRVLEMTYKRVAGRGNPVSNETFARVMAGARDLIGIGALRNLPISIVPSDAAMTLLASRHMGMSGFRVLGEVFNGQMSKAEAAHLQIAAHGYLDFINNNLRLYEDELNYSGLARKASRAVVRATGAEWWTTNGRRGFQTSMLNQIAEATDRPFEKLDQTFRDQFLQRYGIGASDWEKIRAGAEHVDFGFGARYLLSPGKIDEPLYERLLAAVREQGAYAFHQPDARTLAIARGDQPAGSLSGEAWRSFIQYKQFALERATTHLMRIAIDGPIENRVMRGLAYTALSMLAGGVSLQAAQVLAGKDPIDMSNPRFWLDSYAKGGAGAIFGDVLGAAMHGNRSASDIVASFAGPLPNAIGQTAVVAARPFRESKQPIGKEILDVARAHSPATWYTKLAVDRLFWDKLQMLVDPDYRKSFRRSEQNAQKYTGADFFWPPGENTPERAPNPATALGIH